MNATAADTAERSLFAASPARLVAALCLTQIVFWSLIPALTYTALPLDVVEIYAWGPHWLTGSYKHPALTSWLLEISRTLTGTAGWPAYLVSQVWIALTFVLIFALGRGPLGSERAATATLLMPWIYYFGWHTPEFNHDIIQLPLWVAIALAAWSAVETQRIAWWVCLGAVAALALYGKLASNFMLIATATWLLADGHARRSLRTPGPWLALCVFLILSIPLCKWLLSPNAIPLQFAVQRGSLNSKTVPIWIAIQVAIASGVLIPIAITRLRSRTDTFLSRPVIDARFKIFLLFVGLGPLLLAVAAFTTLATGAKLMWGVPMLSFTGLLAVAFLPERWTAVPVRRLAVLTCVFTAVLSLIHGATMLREPEDVEHMKRSQWPQAEISQRMRAIFANETGHPLTIVAGPIDNWLAGLISVSKADILDIYTAADSGLSPWVTRERLATEGALVVWSYPECGVPEALAGLLAGMTPRQERFKLSGSGDAAPLRIGFAVYSGTKDGEDNRPPNLSQLMLLPTHDRDGA